MHAMVEHHRAEEEPVRHFQAMTRALIRQGQESGEIRTDVRAEDAAVLLESAFHRTLAQWLAAGGSRAKLHRTFQAKLDIVFAGIARPARPRRAARAKGRS
jgi:methylphosphotriester-DNA--protein-cysteine methyltransferase